MAKGRPLRLDREALLELHSYAVSRLEGEALPGGDAEQVERDVSTLKHLLRLSLALGGPATPTGLIMNAETLGRIIAAPGRIHGTSVSAMWSAAQRFAAFRRPEEEEKIIAAIDAHLNPRRPLSWDHAERTTGGSRRGTRKRGHLIFAAELLAVTNLARADKRGERAMRDLTFAALCCWSPLRLYEVRELRWEQVSWDRAGDVFPVWVSVSRRNGEFQLPVHRNGAQHLTAFYRMTEAALDHPPTGPVFRSVRAPFAPLSDREARRTLYDALARAGLKGADTTDLHAGFADFLERVVGIGELELTEIFAYSNHDITRRLLQRHHAYHLRQRARGGGEDGR
jgi:integrase